MSQVTTSITLNDGSATPVAKTFAPERVAPELTTFTERTATSSNGFLRLNIRFNPASAKRATNRTTYSLEYPVTTVVDGVNTVAYTLRGEVTFVMPDKATASERANLIAFVSNSLLNSQLKAVTKDLDPLY